MPGAAADVLVDMEAAEAALTDQPPGAVPQRQQRDTAPDHAQAGLVVAERGQQPAVSWHYSADGQGTEPARAVRQRSTKRTGTLSARLLEVYVGSANKAPLDSLFET